MQARRIRLQDPQLELFCSQSEVVDWPRLPRETQQATKKLLAKLLREHSETQLLRSELRESKHE